LSRVNAIICFFILTLQEHPYYFCSCIASPLTFSFFVFVTQDKRLIVLCMEISQTLDLMFLLVIFCGSGWVSHLWFGFEFGKFPLKMSNFTIFSLRVEPESTQVKGVSASYLLRVKSKLRLGQSPSLVLIVTYIYWGCPSTWRDHWPDWGASDLRLVPRLNDSILF